MASSASLASNLSTLTNIGSSQSLLSGPSFSNQTSVASNMSNLSNLSTMTNAGSQSSLMSTDSAIQIHNNLANLSMNNIHDATAPTQMSQFLHASTSNLQSQTAPDSTKLPPLPSLFGSNPPPQAPQQTFSTPFTPAFQHQQQSFQPAQISNPADANQAVSDFSKYFQPAATEQGPFNPGQSSNQIIQNLVQQTISNHFNQQQQQSQEVVQHENGHGHSHDHSAHGHSHDHSAHGHSH